MALVIHGAQLVYHDTKANIEALDGLAPDSKGYATDTHESGWFDGTDWHWASESVAITDHDHSGDAGDGGQFDAANLTAGESTDGQVLTSDGAGGAAWEDVSPGGVIGVDGWITATGTWTFSSADAPTYVISVNNDQTAIIGVGMRIKLTHGG